MPWFGGNIQVFHPALILISKGLFSRSIKLKGHLGI